jgi:hypothetical protein
MKTPLRLVSNELYLFKLYPRSGSNDQAGWLNIVAISGIAEVTVDDGQAATPIPVTGAGTTSIALFERQLGAVSKVQIAAGTGGFRGEMNFIPA